MRGNNCRPSRQFPRTAAFQDDRANCFFAQLLTRMLKPATRRFMMCCVVRNDGLLGLFRRTMINVIGANDIVFAQI